MSGEDKFTGIVLLVYAVLSYWAAGQTIYANKIRMGTAKDLFLNRLIVGLLLGLILIPVAILKTIFSGRNK